MSNLSGNPYVESSRNQNHQSNESLTQATYALAYEQRTANLIALWANPEATLMDLKTGRQRTTGLGTDIMDKVLAEITKRLGL